MDLPDCPPGAEGYEDSIVEVAGKKPEDTDCTKAEKEFQEHLNSLKVKVEDGSTRSMVERQGRDISGKWIYLCFPCAAMCSGESVLQTHTSGKKHKHKLSQKNVWPVSIFEEHPFVKGMNANKSGASEKTVQKVADELDPLSKNVSQPEDAKYNKYKSVECHLQEALDGIKVPLIGLEYLIEHPPEQSHYEPTYICTLCLKQGHPRTIINHLTCFWHRHNYINRHYTKACGMLASYRNRNEYREAVTVIMNRLTQRIEEKYGRRRPLHIDKDEFERDKEGILQWIFKGFHCSEQMGSTFEEIVDIDLINSLHKTYEQQGNARSDSKKDPSPPVVAAPSKSMFNSYSKPAGRNPRRAPSTESLSDISGDEKANKVSPRRGLPQKFGRDNNSSRYAPYPERRSDPAFRSRYAIKNNAESKSDDNKKAPNHEYKIKLANDMCQQTKTAAEKTLAYHEKNPEKHPLYPEEWKKFWNRRYKEIQAEGKDPSKHDFKPEWIVFWTNRMKDLFNDELRANIHEIYRKLCLTPPDLSTNISEPHRRTPEHRRHRSPAYRFSPGRRRSPHMRARSPDLRRRSPDPRRRSPDLRRRSPDPRRRSPELRRRSPEPRRRSPEPRKRSPLPRRRSPVPRLTSPITRHLRTRSRSPVRQHSGAGGGRSRSPARTHIQLESLHKRSESPLSRRDSHMRNRSPERKPAMQTVLISDDEMKPGSPWNSDDDMDSLGSLPDAKSPLLRPVSRTDSSVSRHTARSKVSHTYARDHLKDLGATDNVVATLRLLVALEDYLGSLGPKIVDLLTEALKMEKEKANSSEKLLDREDSVALMETAKEKLKGAVQAGLVATAALAAVRSAIVRVASVLHEADKRAKKKPKDAAVPVAGVGQVDRAQIAKQMAAALIAQGKTDVSSEELAQLVDAVVGMAEAKKRKEFAQLAPSTSAPPSSSSVAPTASASALQMLQSAYDENDKKLEKEETPDAMDGLSDSDLETLLKNFNELSAEEQHSLIAYLKKLEAKEPRRVERLREYVTTAATTAPRASQPVPALSPAPAAAAASAPAPAPAPTLVNKDTPKVVTLDSDDDDDYNVEEVFKSATQKVKEDQIRQEMEIVTKSLLESKPEEPETPANAFPGLDIIKGTSAANLLAIVQASIAQAAPAEVSSEQKSGVVVSSNTQPRTFGDKDKASSENTEQVSNQNQPLLQKPDTYQGSGLNNNQQMPGQNYGGNVDDRNMLKNNTNNSGNIPKSNSSNIPMNNSSNIPMNNSVNIPINNSGNIPMNNSGNMGMNRNIPIKDDRHKPIFDRNINMNNRNMQMNNPNNMPINNNGVQMQSQNYGGNINDRTMHMNNSNVPMNNSNMPMNNSNMPMNNSRNMPLNNSSNMRNINQGINNWDSRSQMQHVRSDNPNQGPGNQWDARQKNMQDHRGPVRATYDNNQQQHNQGPRNNYMNNSDNMQQDRNRNHQQQQFGNNNFRGRGRGNYGGGQRGRGRGGYY